MSKEEYTGKEDRLNAVEKEAERKMNKPIIKEFDFETTAELKVNEKIVGQVIGQDHAIEIVKKAAQHRRHVLLIGAPGTGKSMLGRALAELLPTKGKLEDVLCYPNEKDTNVPIVKIFPAGEGERTVVKIRQLFEASTAARRSFFIFIGLLFIIGTGYFLWTLFKDSQYAPIAMVSGVGNIIWLVVILGFLMNNAGGAFRMISQLAMLPKPLVTHKKEDPAPFIDATGAHAGALLGDVLHDPLQSGNLGTPAHERVMPGMIHRANGGVLFIDEVANLKPESQQELLTALQEKKYPITGQSERSSGSMVRTQPVPCDFVLVAAGNVETVEHMHPALRSRIRGYGYEVFMKDSMPDTSENRMLVAKFIAQEVTKDEKIPHFTKEAVEEVILLSKKMCSRKGHLTLRLRELGGIIRAAGDLGIEEKTKYITKEQVQKARKIAKPLDQQMADWIIEQKKEYEVFLVKGTRVGRVNGLAVMGQEGNLSGIMLPIEAEVTIGGKEKEIIATGKLGEIAKEAIKNVSAIIKKRFGEDINEKHDIYVQFVQAYNVEGDSASIAVATAIISALKNIPVKQEIALTGSLSIRGEVLPIGGAHAKVEAAIDAGITTVIVPKENVDDIILTSEKMKKITIIPVSTIQEVLKYAFDWKGFEEVRKIMGAE